MCFIQLYLCCLKSIFGFFVFKQKTAYEMRISDWSSDVCSSDLKVAVLLAILLFVPPLIDNPYVTRIFISAMMLGVMAAIYDLMIGYAGLVNFGYAGFIAVGAYTSALGEFHYGISPWLGLFFGGVLSAFLGFLLGVITLRLRGLYVALMTFFVGEAICFSIPVRKST